MEEQGKGLDDAKSNVRAPGGRRPLEGRVIRGTKSKRCVFVGVH